MMPEAEERDASIADDAADEHMEGAVEKIIVIARDEHILAPARLDSPMNVPFRPDVLLIAMIAQILVRLLHLLDERSRIIRRGIV